ncbi:MAG: VTT domain-containing protein [Rectinema sp.]|nr:VTT domain-containing protein [Rectinema sp.]
MATSNGQKGTSQVKLSDFAFPALLVALVVLGIALRGQLVPLLEQRETLRERVRSLGSWGWLLFFLLQVLQVVVFVIPGEIIQLTGGFIFGFWGGFFLTTGGIGIGSAINFLLGRWLGPRFLRAILRESTYQNLEAWTRDARTFAGLIMLFFIPGIPKDVLCYMAGAGGRGFVSFIIASMIARMPGILGSTLAGSATYRGDYGLVAVLVIATAVVIAGSILFRERLSALFTRLLHRHKQE